MSVTDDRLAEARALLEAGNRKAGRGALQQLLAVEPNNLTALLMLGGSYYYDQMYAEAEMIYERLILLEPGSGMLSIALFNTLWKQGRYSEAAEEIRRFVSVADKVQERETLERYAALIKELKDQG